MSEALEETPVITTAMVAIGSPSRRRQVLDFLRQAPPFEPAKVPWGDEVRVVTDREGDELDCGVALDRILHEIDRPPAQD